MKLALGPRTGRGVAMSSRSRDTALSRAGGRLRVAGLLLVLGAVVSLAASSPAQAAAPVTVTFAGNIPQAFYVPAKVTSVEIVARGANGNIGWSAGATGGAAGSGSQITGTLEVTPGTRFDIDAGAGGGAATPPGFDCFLGTVDGFSQGGGGGSTSDGDVGPAGAGGHGDLCGGGGGGGGGAGTGVYFPGGHLIAGGGGGGGGSGGIVGYSGGSGGSGSDGGNGSGPGSGNGGGRGGASGGSGDDAGDADAGSSAGGGGGGGSGARGGTAGGAGGGGAGGGGGGGAGSDLIPGSLKNVAVTTAPPGGGHDGSVSFTYTPPDATQTALSCTPASALAGQQVACTVTVDDTETVVPSTPTGTITFSTNGLGDFSANTCTLQGSGTSAQCSFSYTPTALGTGTQTLGMAYSGDDSHSPSNGSGALGVRLRSASTAVKCSPVYIPLEKPATCAATIADSSSTGTAIAPGGTVSFKLDPLSSNMKGIFSGGGQCTLQETGPSAACSVSYTPTVVAGLHEITAVYSGDRAHAGGPGVSQNVSFVIATAAVGRCAGRPVTTPGSVRADRLAGTPKREVIAAGAGDDRISAGGGRDLVCAGAGNDRVRRGPGNDRLLGQAGNDTLSGGAGRDVLNGGQGNDRIFGGPGKDRITPGPGRDRVAAGAGRDRIFSRDSRRDVIHCGPGHDIAKVDAVDRTRRCETVIRAHPPR
jgi:hypothetical protein